MTFKLEPLGGGLRHHLPGRGHIVSAPQQAVHTHSGDDTIRYKTQMARTACLVLAFLAAGSVLLQQLYAV